MRQETTILDAIGNIGDFVGGIGVVITLLYLTTQIRENTASSRTSSRQDVSSGFRDYNRLSLDPENRHVLVAGIRRYGDLSADQKWLFSAILTDHAHAFQSTFALHEAGTLEDEIFETYLTWFAAWAATPGGAVWWAEVSPFHHKRMTALVEEHSPPARTPPIILKELIITARVKNLNTLIVGMSMVTILPPMAKPGGKFLMKPLRLTAG